MNLQVPYERIVQWVAGPFAAVVGVLATKAVTHMSFLGNAGLQQSSVAHGITDGSVFVATALVTYAGHQKWLTNLAKWWDAAANPATPVALPPPTAVSVPTDTSGLPPTISPTTTDILRTQLLSAGIKPGA